MKYNRPKFQKRQALNVFEMIFSKEITKEVMLLYKFVENKTVPQKEILDLFYNKPRDKFELVIQKIGISVILYRIRENYNIYIRSFSGNEPYYKILTTKEDFNELIDAIDKRIENLEIRKSNIKDIINNFDNYLKTTNEILKSVKERGKY
jgi:hypothetical protein